MGLIHLYSATSTSFDGNGTPLVTAREAVVKRDEGFQLTFNIPISQNDLHKRVQKEMIVSAMTPDGVNYFRIWDIEKRTTDVKVTALQLLYSLDVKKINPFGGKRFTGNTVLQAFASSFKSSISPYTFSSSILTSKDFYTNEKDDTSTSHNALAILNKITDSWSGELMLNGFDVRMISKLGTKTDALLYEHKNIASFSDSSSMNGIVTRIYATATYTPERAEGATEDPEPVVLTATVDSPLINQYALVYEATMEYNDARTVAELRTEILRQYSEFNVDKPERTIDVDTNIVDGTAINFGDELVLKYLVHDVDEVIRCVGYEYDPISENYIGVTLGTLEKTFLTKVTEGLSTSVTRKIDKINKQIQAVQTAANGKNRVTYGPNPVPNAIEGDLWFKHPEGRPDEIELLIYQNGLWLPAPFLTDQDKAQFEQEMADHYDAAMAEVERKDAEYKEIFDAYDAKVVTIDQSIADAATKAQSALEEARVSTDLAQTAKDLATTAQTNASTAISNARQAISDASGAVSQALSAFNLATQATSDVNTISLDVDDLAGQVALKASQTEVDTVKGTVSNHTSTLSQHAIEINARLTSTQVSDLVDGKGLAKVTYVDNQISATADSFGIDMIRVEGKIDGLQVGGRNLLTGTSESEQEVKKSSWHIGSWNPSLTIGEEYTFSFDIKSANATNLRNVFLNSSNSGFIPNTPISKEWTRISFTFKWKGGTYNGTEFSPHIYPRPNYLGTYVSRIKLEKGNVATDWSPAPEDTMMQNDFTVFKNSYQSTVDSINTELSKTAKTTDLKGMVTESILATKQFVTQGSINTTLSNYLKTTDLNGKLKETVAYQDIKETTDRYTRVIGSTDAESRTKIAQIAMTDSVFKTTVLDKMEFDTSNTFSTKTSIDTLTNMLQLYRNQSEAPNGIRFAGGAGGGGSFRLWNVITRNGWWTVSGWVRGSQNLTNSFRIDIADSPYSHYITFEKDNTWKYFEFSHEVKNHSSTYNFVDFNGIANLYYYIKDLKIEQNHKATPYSLAAADVATQSQVTQLAGSWALTLKSGNDIKTQINASTDSIRLASKFIHLSGTSLIDDAVIKSAMIDTLNVSKLTGTTAEFTALKGKVITASSITADRLVTGTALVDRVFVDTAAITQLTSKTAFINNIKAIEIDVAKITGNTASFISAGFKSLNSQSTINGHAIRIQNSAGEFVEMNNTPELRSDDAGGTAVVLGKGRVHFYDSRGHSKGYVGTDMHTAGSYDFGTFLSKGSGIYKFARMADATQTTYAYYTVKSGLTAPASVITNMVQNGYLPDGNAQQFVAKGNMLSQLNGWPNYPNWPTLTAGQKIRYKELTTQTTGDAYETIWKFGPSSQGDWRIYFSKHATFEGGTTGTSDRRLKHSIEPTQIEALHHIESLTFKEFRWNRDNKYEPLGLIAQDSGILRVSDDDMEGIDIQRAIMLGIKGVQELQEIVKAQAEKIKQLEEIINQ